MSTMTTDRPATVTRRFDAEPRVQMLPPFVAQRAKSRSAARLGVLFVILGSVVAGGMFVLGVFRTTAADLALADASATTQSILQQQSEYRIATDTAQMVQQTTETQLVVTSYEIDWAELLLTVQGFLPAGGLIQNVTATNQAPWAASLEIEDPLRTPRIASIELVVNTASIPEAVALVERLRELDGFADAVVKTSAVGVDGRATTTIVLTLSTDAVSGRFLETDEDEDAASGESTEPEDDTSTDSVEQPTSEGGEG
ncbi:hypothetical protein [Pseudolysinimonas yzui]|uniref:PilN domain-containing protein n=1 Tax=Pseudolysinimonas yzui TaxID=2708254 RepID=A0A8J3M5C4_9MICO|nr:hypothetical protein [Pseudolysinimonas yzui]GHF20915.1 hypothetical protein GCM10011600_22440 [Pseudolysinimonas yzui]